MGDAFDVAVGDGALAHPGLEHRLDAAFKLLHGVVGEGLAEGVLDDLLELDAETLEVFRGEIRIFRNAARFLDRVEAAFQLVADAVAVFGLEAAGLLHHHVGVHGDQAAVGVIGKALVAAHRDKPRERLGAEADVEHRVHHAGHGLAGARTHRKEQGGFSGRRISCP